MASKLTVTPPVYYFDFRNSAGNQVEVPNPAGLSAVLEFDSWAVAKGTPAAIAATVDPVNGTVSSGLSIDRNTDAGDFIGLALILTARKKADATTSLLANTIKAVVSGVVIAQIAVSAASQAAGQHIWFAEDDDGGDSRLNFASAGTAITGGAIEADDEKYTKTAHGLITGQRVFLTSMTGGTGFTPGATSRYWFHRLDANTGYLCSSYANALAGTPNPASTDGTSVVLTPEASLAIELTQLDPALELLVHLAGRSA